MGISERYLKCETFTAEMVPCYEYSLSKSLLLSVYVKIEGLSENCALSW